MAMRPPMAAGLTAAVLVCARRRPGPDASATSASIAFTMAMGAGAGAGPPTAERMVLTRAASI